MTNRLASSTSPDLLQHAANPLDLQEWGEEAFAKARTRNVPILLSVGCLSHGCETGVGTGGFGQKCASVQVRGLRLLLPSAGWSIAVASRPRFGQR